VRRMATPTSDAEGGLVENPQNLQVA
jgi:hypothetical protein